LTALDLKDEKFSHIAARRGITLQEITVKWGYKSAIREIRWESFE
jgi:hypothetical protein